ncbi:hypothetical protein QBC33DRAFT_313064 [Phialemonium atrogriseum]|uniref:non-specific serine/threonine protein kinase n=1 Tax=Phialemonium atrogriseum TaxID=1093897 RepID=A0AAJ0C561_9PEZI|nr:uncharacterized protein QBC33DRAFT_313064 [Phialemonium atrogriseum]KAK1770146.1 hypothetical protein QBC33DRAFT_313064 [Phialemonium atrogriseum]
MSKATYMDSTDLSSLRYRHSNVSAEDLEKYCKGGCCPIDIGDEIADGRFKIVHKLGFGGFSTVWLARDRTKERYVAFKVIVADHSD